MSEQNPDEAQKADLLESLAIIQVAIAHALARATRDEPANFVSLTATGQLVTCVAEQLGYTADELRDKGYSIVKAKAQAEGLTK